MNTLRKRKHTVIVESKKLCGDFLNPLIKTFEKLSNQDHPSLFVDHVLTRILVRLWGVLVKVHKVVYFVKMVYFNTNSNLFNKYKL